MLRWMFGVTKKDRILNEHVRGSLKVAPVTKEITVITEKRLKWCRHAKRRDEGHMLGRMLDVEERDMESVGLKEEDALDRIKRENYMHNYSGDPR